MSSQDRCSGPRPAQPTRQAKAKSGSSKGTKHPKLPAIKDTSTVTNAGSFEMNSSDPSHNVYSSNSLACGQASDPAYPLTHNGTVDPAHLQANGILPNASMTSNANQTDANDQWNGCGSVPSIVVSHGSGVRKTLYADAGSSRLQRQPTPHGREAALAHEERARNDPSRNDSTNVVQDWLARNAALSRASGYTGADFSGAVDGPSAMAASTPGCVANSTNANLFPYLDQNTTCIVSRPNGSSSARSPVASSTRIDHSLVHPINSASRHQPDPTSTSTGQGRSSNRAATSTGERPVKNLPRRHRASTTRSNNVAAPSDPTQLSVPPRIGAPTPVPPASSGMSSTDQAAQPSSEARPKKRHKQMGSSKTKPPVSPTPNYPNEGTSVEPVSQAQTTRAQKTQPSQITSVSQQDAFLTKSLGADIAEINAALQADLNWLRSPGAHMHRRTIVSYTGPVPRVDPRNPTVVLQATMARCFGLILASDSIKELDAFESRVLPLFSPPWML